MRKTSVFFALLLSACGGAPKAATPTEPPAAIGEYSGTATSVGRTDRLGLCPALASDGVYALKATPEVLVRLPAKDTTHLTFAFPDGRSVTVKTGSRVRIRARRFDTYAAYRDHFGDAIPPRWVLDKLVEDERERTAHEVRTKTTDACLGPSVKGLLAVEGLLAPRPS